MKEKIFFSPQTKEQWIEAARTELDGVHPLEKLAFQSDEIKLLPYYNRSDSETIKRYSLPVSNSLFLGPRAWFNLAPVTVLEPKSANKAALAYLNSGADGLFFDIQINSYSRELLEGVEIPYCALGFVADQGHGGFFGDFSKYILENQISTLAGVIFWKSTPSNCKEIANNFSAFDQFYSNGIIAERNSSPTEEIATSLAQAVNRIDELTNVGVKLEVVLRSIAFSVPVGLDFFCSIAKLKALRQLWNQIIGAYAPSFKHEVFIHAYSSPWIASDYQPHGNMIQSTIGALSAVLGGCDGLSVYPEDASQLTGRIARNVSCILREESHLSAVADPVAGAFYIDHLTDQLAQRAWVKFQQRIATKEN